LEVEVRLEAVGGGNGGTSASSLESALECIGYAKCTGTAKHTDNIKSRGYVMCVGYKRATVRGTRDQFHSGCYVVV
jgi:hypothetical protein